MGWPEETIGNCRLILGDCREVLPTLGPVDVVVTDPPYGIGNKHNGGGGGGRSTWQHKPEIVKRFDMSRPPKEVFAMLLALGKEAVIFGGNYFTDYLPPRMGWLLWDKGYEGFSPSDFEMAWTTRDGAARRLKYNHGNERGFAPKSHEARKFINCHPTQKPVAVMKWCLGFFPEAYHVLDPFMGSGTTGVACVQLGRTFLGIEIESRYFDLTCQRITEAYAQPDLFVETFAPAQQLSLGVP